MSSRVVTMVLQRKLVKREQTRWPSNVIDAGTIFFQNTVECMGSEIAEVLKCENI